MIKGMLTGALTATLMLSSVETAGTFAPHHMQMQNFISGSSNIICDYTKNACSYTDADGDGICDNRGTQTGNGYGAGGAGYGMNYVDANDDGICDNYTAGAQPQGGAGQGNCGNWGNGAGCGNGRHGGNGYHGGRGR